jgi:hypothetical protein
MDAISNLFSGILGAVIGAVAVVVVYCMEKTDTAISELI